MDNFVKKFDALFSRATSASDSDSSQSSVSPSTLSYVRCGMSCDPSTSPAVSQSQPVSRDPSLAINQSCDHSTKQAEYMLALEADLEAMHKKFLALYHHTSNLAQDLLKKDELIATLEESEGKAYTLYCQQKTAVQSAIALANKDRKRKFVLGHTVSYSATAPTAAVYDEVSAAAIRLLEEQRQAKREEIASLANKVDQLAMVYSPHRYNLPSSNNESPPKVIDDPENLPEAVPAQFFAIWMCEGEMTPTEENKFDTFMERQVRPPPIYSLNLIKPYVNWHCVNPFQEKNLPKPYKFPLHGCSQDPEFYHVGLQ